MFSGKAAVNLALLLSRRMDAEGERAAYRLAAEVGDCDDQAQATGCSPGWAARSSENLGAESEYRLRRS